MIGLHQTTLNLIEYFFRNNRLMGVFYIIFWQLPLVWFLLMRPEVIAEGFLAKNPNNDTTRFGCTPLCRWGAFYLSAMHPRV